MGLSEQELAEIEKRVLGEGYLPSYAESKKILTEIRRLRSVISWYGDRDNWNILAVRERCPIERDKGQRAREALK